MRAVLLLLLLAPSAATTTNTGHFARLLPETQADEDLVAAARENNIEGMEAALAAGAEYESKIYSGVKALIAASANGHVDAAKLLLTKGVDVNGVDDDGYIDGDVVVEGSRRTALMKASSEGRVDVVKLLLAKGADVNAKAGDDTTALMFASQDGHVDVVKLLLENGAGSSSVQALVAASSEGHVDAVKLLLTKGADVNGRFDGGEDDGYTALMRASSEGRIDVVKLLLAKGADLNMTRDGKTAFDLACGCEHAAACTGIADSYAGRCRYDPGMRSQNEDVQKLLKEWPEKAAAAKAAEKAAADKAAAPEFSSALSSAPCLFATILAIAAATICI